MMAAERRKGGARTPAAVDYFSRHGDEYADTTRSTPNFEERFHLFETWLEQIAAGATTQLTCVDLGCGPGTLSVAAAKRGYRVLSIDGSASMLEAVARNALREHVKVDVRRMKLPLDGAGVQGLQAAADVVVASSVIEYIRDEEHFVRQCREILRPGGTALVSFANERSIARAAERRLRHTPLYRGSYLRVQLHQDRAEDARRLFEACGLSTVAVKYFSLPVSAYRVWRSDRRPSWLATMFLVVGRR